jgi:hypothetical protein
VASSLTFLEFGSEAAPCLLTLIERSTWARMATFRRSSPWAQRFVVSAPSHRSGALAAIVAIALLAAGCGGGMLSAKSLSQESKSLQSLASEGALLGRDAHAGRTTRTFTRVHSRELFKAASKAATSLRAAKTAPKLEPKLRKLTFLAGKISVDLKLLGHASKTEQALLAHELELAARKLE